MVWIMCPAWGSICIRALHFLARNLVPGWGFRAWVQSWEYMVRLNIRGLGFGVWDLGLVVWGSGFGFGVGGWGLRCWGQGKILNVNRPHIKTPPCRGGLSTLSRSNSGVRPETIQGCTLQRAKTLPSEPRASSPTGVPRLPPPPPPCGKLQ